MESEKKKKGGGSFFQMPLHYPRYTKKDYEDMPEWKLDRLLAEYGLPARGDLPYKRQFAMGAFLWPADHFHNSHNSPNPSLRSSFKNADSLLSKKVL